MIYLYQVAKDKLRVGGGSSENKASGPTEIIYCNQHQQNSMKVKQLPEGPSWPYIFAEGLDIRVCSSSVSFPEISKGNREAKILLRSVK